MLIWVGMDVESIIIRESVKKVMRQDICFYPGKPEYCMNESVDYKENSFLGIAYYEREYGFDEGDGYYGYDIENTDGLHIKNVFEAYGIKTINWKCDPQTQNIFK